MKPKNKAFLDILETYKGLLYKIVNSYCPDKDDREDLMQEIIIQLWLSFDNYDSNYKISTWMYRIALNTAISFYRKHKKRKAQTVELAPFMSSSLLEEVKEKHPDLAILQQLIQQLPKMDKALILLHLESVPYKEIAEIMGLTATNASTKIARIKQRLKTTLTKHKSKDHAK